MALGKRGVVFTLMAIVIATVIVVGFENYSTPSITDKNPTLLRVQIMDRTVDSFFTYVEDALVITVQDSLTNMSRILASGTAATDPELDEYYTQTEFNNSIKGCVFNPAYGVSYFGPSVDCMDNSLPEILAGYTDLVEENLNIKIIFSFDQESFTLEHITPFTLRAEVDFFVNVTDVMANWTINETISTVVPLDRVMDPVTAKVAANDSFSDPDFTPYYFEMNDILNNHADIVEFIGSNTFRPATNRAPSALQRFVGDFSSSEYGIEAFINGSQLDSAPNPWTAAYPGAEFLGLSSNFSFIDHELFNPGSAAGFKPTLYYCNEADTPHTRYIDIDGTDTKTYFWMNISTMDHYPYSDTPGTC